MAQEKQQQSQFMHVELYSRAGTTLKNGTKKTSSGSVIAEAIRELGFTDHIIADGFQPTAPTYIFSQGDLSLEQHYAQIIEQVDTEKDALGRKIKTDKNILLAGVVSYPKPRIAEWSSDDKQNYILFVEQSLSFMQKEWGKNLLCVIEHKDEQYPHLHFYVANKTRIASAPDLHPGHFARAKIEKETKALKMPANRTAEAEAYKNSMKKFQDDFFSEVGIHCGFTRLGPKVQRLNRTEWRERKRVAKLLAKAFSLLKKDVEKSNENSINLNKSMSDVEARIAEIIGMQSELYAERKELDQNNKKIEAGVSDLELAKYVKENFPLIASEFRLKKIRSAQPKIPLSTSSKFRR